MRRWLLDARTDKGYSQSYMAQALGISRQYYNFIEARERQKVLPLNVAERLAEVLHIPLKQICKWESELQ